MEPGGALPTEPGDREGFDVEVRSGAIEANDRLPDVVEEHGRMLGFGSRSEAEEYARRLSSSSGSLRIQSVAPNDPRDLDAYLLAGHDPSIKEPAEVDGETLTFDVGANLYGALGEAVLLNAPRPHAIIHFVKRDLGLDNGGPAERLRVDVEAGSFVSLDDAVDGTRLNWVPDCVVFARNGWNGPVLEKYYCEIKTGNASFERSQAAAMERLAEEERVLKIRILIEELPERYSLRIQEVEP